MAVKGAIRIVVLVIPHIELYSRHQDVLELRQFKFALNVRHFIPHLQSATACRRLGSRLAWHDPYFKVRRKSRKPKSATFIDLVPGHALLIESSEISWSFPGS